MVDGQEYEDELARLVEASELDGLVRFVDGAVTRADWDLLADVRDRCYEAVARGKQVWGAGQFAEYRLALDAPAAYAASAVRTGAGRFSLGPLWEVAASTHSWDDLGHLVGDPASRTLVAHERALRGDEVTVEGLLPDVVDVPLWRAAWEPRYPVATYRSDGVDLPEVELPVAGWVDLPEAASVRSDTHRTEALLDLVRPWIDDSNGRGQAIAVSGSAAQAIRAMGPRRVRSVEITLDQAMAVMAWAGASGGAHGRRRGTPVGRSLAWWALACLVGMDADWPVDAEELGRQASPLRWLWWEPGDHVGGWALHLAAEHPAEGLAWVVSAVDAL